MSPLPANPVKTENVLANDSKGLTQSQPKPVEKKPDAIPIPDKATKIKPTPKTSATNRSRTGTRGRSRQPGTFGQGGPVSGPYGNFNANGAKGGFGFTGGGGDFGSRYSWYVRVVQQKVSENWLKYEVDPRITDGAARVYHLRLHARRASRRTCRLSSRAAYHRSTSRRPGPSSALTLLVPCPRIIAANKVSVEFWFDYKR